MGIQDNQPLSSGARQGRPPEEVLSSVIHELESFQRDVQQDLSQDIQRLQRDKHQLIQEVEQLRQEQENLRFQRIQTLSERQISQQQVWLKQLAQLLASNVQRELILRINQGRSGHQPLLEVDPEGVLLPGTEANADLPSEELEAVLNSSLNQTFRELQKELNSYQSDLSERLVHMQSLEQQVEALLEAVVNRLRGQLDNQGTQLEPEQPTSNILQPTPRPLPPRPTTTPKPSQPIVTPPPSQIQKNSRVQLGLILAFLSAITLSVFNVCIKILLKSSEPRQIFGVFDVTGVIAPGIGNSLLILLLRMIVVMALMPIVATLLYPAVWNDLQRFLKSGDRALMRTVIGSGFFLFLSQVSIYIALGEIRTGIAITIFFIYPIVTVFASWALFGDRPSWIRIAAMSLIIMGAVLSLPNLLGTGPIAFGNPQLGVTASVMAGITFAGYVLLTQIAAGKLHPIPFSLVNFAAIFVFSAVSLIGIGLLSNFVSLPQGVSVMIAPDVGQGLMIGGIILGILTLCSYLLNNFAIRNAGAALASIIATTGPALTALFAWLIIGEKLSVLQVFGMLLVISGVAAMSLERMFLTQKKAKA
ncbi:MAG: EamA family transporter [Oscillatoriales cyanobacterium RM2_1_1]|nr:EamA family transporter [Oscillatoriales cyanobacterium RM2_1_1]